MKYEDVKEAAAEKSGKSLSQYKDKIERAIAQALDSLNTAFRWPFAIKDLGDKTLPANMNYININQKDFFQPVSVTIVLGNGNKYALRWLNYSTFKNQNDAIVGTVVEPGRYSMASQRLYVGPGPVSGAATLKIAYQKRLTVRDIALFPDGNVIVEGALIHLLDVVDLKYDKAVVKYERVLDETLATYNITSVQQEKRPLDQQILHNQAYISSKITGV